MYKNINFFKTEYIHENPEDTKTKNFTLEPALNNILQAVHSQLKYNPKPSVPKIPKPIAETMTQNNYTVFPMGARNKLRQNSGRQTIPRLQADMEMHKKHMGGQSWTSDKMSFQNQQRYREVLRQKRILENMLQEHQKLQSDRDSIANEISFMRSYLDTIRNRLDVSLRRLNMQKTVSHQPRCNKKSRAHPYNKIVKPAGVVSENANRMNAKLPRMLAGGQASVYTANKRVPPTGRYAPAQTVSAKKTVTNVCPAKKHAKQWVYCSRIERKNEPSLL